MRCGVGRWLIGITVVLMPGCGDSELSGVRDVETAWHDVDVLGQGRSYRMYTPVAREEGTGPDTSTGHPLLLVFHGATQGASGVELMSWLYPAADEAGLVVAYPQAAGDYWNTPNSPPGYWEIPDVQFADAVIEDIAARLPIDRSRIYAAGYSNGAIFAQVLGCLRSTTVSGVAIVGAGVSAQLSASCPWERPVPTVVFFGDADPQFFWDDGFAAGVGMLGGERSAEWLAENNGCEPEPLVIEMGPDETSDTSAELWRYSPCLDDAEIDFYRIVRGGHTWPGSPVNFGPGFGRKSRAVDASATMVDFFLTHSATGAR